jgi:guanine deaminase
MERSLIFHGTFIYSTSLETVEIIKNGLMVINPTGCISDLHRNIAAQEAAHLIASLNPGLEYTIHYLQPGTFLIPGFVDTHNHAPQWAQRGLGRGLQILDWLDTITFPNEAKFANLGHAQRIYADCVDGFLKQGITTASYYGSLHGPATLALAQICQAKGQRALVGKCNMDRNCPEFYREESAEDSLFATRELISRVTTMCEEPELLVRPIITPRFAITCSPELLRGLGDMAKKENLPIQTHFNEAQSEIDATLSLFPEFKNEADLYESFGLLTDRSILAHCTHMTEYEMGRLKSLECGVAHCPIANTTVGGGFMAAPIREFLRRGIKVGLGTDSGGGFSSSILDAMRQAFIVSNAREMLTKGQDPTLSVDECFYLATLGGARVCGLGDKIGSFEVGKEFDAIVVSVVGEHKGVVTIVEEEDSVRTVFEKFLMTGDDRNIAEVYVRGRAVKT